MLKVGDKIKYVKVNQFVDIPLGTTMDIADITNNWVVVNTEYVVNGRVVGFIKGVMTYDEIEKYFEKVIETKEPKRVWTEWIEINDNMAEHITHCNNYLACRSCKYQSVCDILSDVKYRTNNKKVMVRYTINGTNFTAEATCHKSDEFDLIKGLRLACARLGVKVSQYYVKSIIKEIG